MNQILWMAMFVLIQIGLARASESQKIRIVTTANVHGETDPCG